jgi:hypothetical protein
MWAYGLDISRSGYVPDADCFENDKEPLGSVTQLSICELPQKDCAPVC